MRLVRLALLLFHKDQSRRDLEHVSHDNMVLEGVIKDTGNIGGVFLILLKKGKSWKEEDDSMG